MEEAPVKNGTSEDLTSTNSLPDDEFVESWGFNLNELYALATTFLKEKDGKAFHLSYVDKTRLVALSQQVSHGPFKEDRAPPVGYLDIIGRDRRAAWVSLGQMGAQEAKGEFVRLLGARCPPLRPFVLAHRCHLQEQEERRRRREEAEEEERRLREEEERQQEEEERWEEEQRRRRRLVQEALNRQTFPQFKAYAEQHFPADPEQQAVLIRQLQEQHYHQYTEAASEEEEKNNSTPPPPEEVEKEEGARMWTRGGVADFKASVRAEGGDGVLTVGHGETVTVRVPTHRDGARLFWEFATDGHDLGFGVLFDPAPPATDADARVTVHVTDDTDEDDEEDAHGSCVVVVPVFRRDCHEEVYSGSHAYPGQGVYSLKFDNSYSLWRAKTLYYRVYYTT